MTKKELLENIKHIGESLKFQAEVLLEEEDAPDDVVDGLCYFIKFVGNSVYEQRFIKDE